MVVSQLKGFGCQSKSRLNHSCVKYALTLCSLSGHLRWLSIRNKKTPRTAQWPYLGSACAASVSLISSTLHISIPLESDFNMMFLLWRMQKSLSCVVIFSSSVNQCTLWKSVCYNLKLMTLAALKLWVNKMSNTEQQNKQRCLTFCSLQFLS